MANGEAGRPLRELTKEEKAAAILYVRGSGYYLTRLSNYLKMSHHILARIMKEDEDFSHAIKAAESDFVADIVKNVNAKRPDFLLKSKYAEEFPDRVQVEHSGKLSFTEFIASEEAITKEDDSPET